MRKRMRRVMSWGFVLATIPVAGLAFGTATANAGGSCHSTASAGAGTTVSISGLCFGPTVLYSQPGATVKWTNQDDVAHTVTGLGFQWGSNGDLGQGDSVSYRFTAAGVYPYECYLHPGMVGAVVVGDAGSPSKVQGLVLPVLAPASPAAVATSPAPVAATETSSSGTWRTVSLVSILLLLGAGVIILLLRRQATRRGSEVPA